MSPPKFYLRLVVLAVVIAPVVYLYGIAASNLITLDPITDFCGDNNPGVPVISWSYIPLRNTCHYADGSHRELVPWFVNPLIALCLITIVYGLVQAVRSGNARRRRAANVVAYPPAGAGRSGRPGHREDTDPPEGEPIDE